jgi:hypothetical protein
VLKVVIWFAGWATVLIALYITGLAPDIQQIPPG